MTVVLLIDTFCATGCTYCELPSRAKNPARYGYEKLNNLMNYEVPEVVTVYGGDLFYNRENVRKAYEYACSLPYVKQVQSVSEIQKLERDFDIRVEVAKMCLDAGKLPGIEFSLDFEGPKSGNHVEVLNRFQKELEFGSVNFTAVVTIDQLMSEGFSDKVKQLIEDYKALNFLGFFSVTMDYNAVTTNRYEYSAVLEKTREFFFALSERLEHPVSRGLLPRVAYKHGCLVRTEQTLVKYDGMLSMCGKVSPEYDIEPVSALDITREDYFKFLKSKSAFTKQALNPVCEKCDAKDICGRCPKFLNRVSGFEGSSDMCSFYKSLKSILVNL